jgi:hypothetical protein
MRSAPGVPLTIAELQLSSPLPSPSRHSVLASNNSNNQQHHSNNINNDNNNNNNNNNTHSSSSSSSSSNYNNTTFDPASISTLTKTMIIPPIQFDSPNLINPDLYPLANMVTPNAMKKFTFHLDGRPSIFEEVQVHTNINTCIYYIKY